MNKNKLLRFGLFIIGLLLFLDGFVLVLYKKIHLGTLLPLLIGLGFICTAIWSKSIQQYLVQHTKLKKLWRLGWSLFAIWLISLIGFFGYIHFKTQQNHAENGLDAIIVLGSGITQGKASPTLAKRLDRAGQVAQQQPQAWVVVSGGLDFGETKTEAEVMSKYLEENYKVQSHKILQENKSTSTDLNLKNSQAILQQHDLSLSSKIAIVTSDFHTLRAAAIAEKQGYRNFMTIGAETPLSTRYNAWLREYFAYLSGWVLGEY
ncbi:YdcF family protein [Acinetobacter sp.]|jgi:uncharacterized SAM-binding protein YcdF (DUF218 family)|uniref:YdcF family protein n=1 Tax=Acinetobacter sp. TaxID=472 RepID=UPI00281C24C2|nr:YdcF family protein [Acinetobacter sp.]MDR0236280.1 YdcF family protein [Acinetobacter sp.]